MTRRSTAREQAGKPPQNGVQRVFILTLPYVPPAVLRSNGRGHWAKKHRATQDLKRAVLDRLTGDLPHFDRATVLYRAHQWGKGIDNEGIVMGMKAALDAMVYAGVLTDDSPRYVVSVTAETVKAESRDDVRVDIIVTEA